jgi:hypothetical protein
LLLLMLLLGGAGDDKLSLYLPKRQQQISSK